MIIVLVPVLNRPQNLEPVVRSIRQTSDADILVVNSPDDTTEQYAAVHAAQVDSYTIAEPHGAGDYARKINRAFSITTAPYVLLGADDLRFHPGWYDNLLRVAEDTDAGVIGTNDLGNSTVMAGKHSTHPLVRRSYIDEQGGTLDREPGVVMYEGYGHQNCDTELVTLAKARKTFAFAADSHVEHLHPFWHKSEMDDVYRKGQASSRADAKLYNRRVRTMLRRVDP